VSRILIADDDEQICTIVARLLDHDGHTVTAVHSGAEAIATLRSAPFDLLLLDLVMPQKGGIETIMEIRGEIPRMPIIVMSGKVRFEEESISRLVQHYGAIASLAKPFSSDELRSAVAAALA